MNTYVTRGIFLLVIAIALIFLEKEPMGGEAGADDGIRVIFQDEKGLILELRTSLFEATEIQVDGTAYQRLAIPAYTHGVTETVGSPELPVKGYWVDLPDGMEIELELEKMETETSAGYHVYPTPRKIGLEKDVIEEFCLDPEAYAEDRFSPEERVQRGTVAYFRDQKKAQLLFYPISFNPQAKELQLHTLIRIRVTFVPETGPEMRGFGTAPFTLTTADPNWPPPYDQLYRISTTAEGIYIIYADQLQAAGMDPATIDPRALHLYNRGTEVAIYVAGEEDGTLDPGDYILFYAEPIDTKYTRTNVYWLVAEDTQGLRMNTIDGTPQGTQAPQSFTARFHHEPDQWYWGTAPGPDELDRWFSGQFIMPGDTVQFPLPVKEPAPSGNAHIQISLWGWYEPGDRHITATIDGQPIGEAQWQGQGQVIISGTVNQALLSTWTLSIQSTCPTEDLVLLDWVDVQYQGSFTALENRLVFSSDPEYLGEFHITGFSESELWAFDITDPLDVGRIEGFSVTPDGANYTLTFHDDKASSEERTYIALGSSQRREITANQQNDGIAQVAPPDLTNTQNRADYILITHRDIGWDAQGMPYPWLRDLTEYRQSQGLRAMAVDTDEIYDQFNYGIADPQAIKDFLTYAYVNWSQPAPEYVLLVGDATYDPKGNDSAPGPTVPTYLGWTRYMGETAIDDWFVQISGSDVLGDLYLGRLPARDKDQAHIMTAKIISYEEAPKGQPWQERLLLVADDEEPIFEEMNESIANLVPADYSLTKGYLAEYKIPPKVPNDLTDLIIDEINQGVLIVNYVGHGSTQHWAHEGIFYTKDDIPRLSNDQKLPVLVLMTCLNGYFVVPDWWDPGQGVWLPNWCLVEEMLLATNPQTQGSAGAVAAFASTGMTDAQVQRLLDEGFVEAIFQGGFTRLGQAAHYAKQTLLANSTDQEDTANSFSLMGDPAMALGTDMDSDGMPDDWEITYFGDLSQGPDDDFDADGLTNLEEYLRGTDPTVVNNVVLILTPPDPITIPRGGDLVVQVTITNNTDQAGTLHFATNVTLPNGNTYPASGYLFGHKEITFNPHQSKSGQLSHTIPGGAPLGTYTYHGYIGRPGVGIMDGDHFDFEVITAPALAGPKGWETTVDQDFPE